VVKKLLLDLEKMGFKLDVIGPDVDADIRRTINRYGKDAVKDSVKRQTTAKRGRPAEPDWKWLQPTIELDAREWLKGQVPEKNRSSYGIANDFAGTMEPQNWHANHTRIYDKLLEKRRLMYLLFAVEMSREDYPHKTHLKVLDELEQVLPKSRSLADISRTVVREYKVRAGKLPPAKMSIAEVQTAVMNMQNAAEEASSHDSLRGLRALSDWLSGSSGK
jgi:hypothetical protein